MDFLNSIFSQTREGNVISEQNDVNAVDIGGGAAANLADRIAALRNGGGWDAAEYGITAEEQARRLEATAGNPEALAREDEILRQRAIARAGLDTTGGKVRVMVAGKAAWHKLGVNVAEAPDGPTARTLAGLDFALVKQELSYIHNGIPRAQADAYAIVRQDNGECLGVVGNRYKIIQNDEAFGFLDDVLASFGAKYESAGSLYGGRKVWMLANLPKSCFMVARGDEVRAYAAFVNPHDGSGVAHCYPTTERIECGNTLRVSAKDQKHGIRIRHTGSVKSKIAAASQALAKSVQGFEAFAQNATTLAATPVRTDTARTYFDDVLDAVLDVKAADTRMTPEAYAHKVNPDVSPADFEHCVKQAEKAIQTRGEILEDIVARFNGAKCEANGIKGTAWAALNAITEHADHSKARRKVGTPHEQASRRFESILDGDADEMKQAAYTRAVAMAV